jgi:predicted lactoylglutathione lyase
LIRERLEYAPTTSTGRVAGVQEVDHSNFIDNSAADMIWSEAIHVRLLSHTKWRSFTQMPLPPAGTAGHMLNLSLDSREAVDQMNQAAAANGGRIDYCKTLASSSALKVFGNLGGLRQDQAQ